MHQRKVVITTNVESGQGRDYGHFHPGSQMRKHVVRRLVKSGRTEEGEWQGEFESFRNQTTGGEGGEYAGNDPGVHFGRYWKGKRPAPDILVIFPGGDYYSSPGLIPLEQPEFLKLHLFQSVKRSAG